MNENRRTAYLEQMGIPVWYARRPLEGALETPVGLDLESQAPEADVLEKVSNVSDAGVLQETDPPSVVGQETPEIKSTTEPLNDAFTNGGLPDKNFYSSELNDLQDLQFSFAKIPLGSGVLLLAELEDINAPGFTAAETRLLTAILSSLHTEVLNQGGLDAHLVRWPQLKGKGIAGGAKAAGDFLFAYIESQIARSNFSVLLLLGNSLEYALSESQRQNGEKFTAVKVVSACSLAELLRKPSEKSALWHKIKNYSVRI